MPSLKLSEARERARLVRLHHVAVELDLRREDSFGSVTTLRFDCTEPGAETFVEFSGSRLLEATLNGSRLDDEAWADRRIRLGDLAEHNTLVVRGEMAYSHDGEGLHRHEDPVDGRAYVYAMSFLDAAPRWFACFDQPDLKAPYTVTVRAPQEWTVLGNAPAVRDGDAWVIECERPLATYFTTVCAGPWHSITREHEGRVLGIHAKQSLAAELERESGDILAVTAAAFTEYGRLFDAPYGFGDYHQVFVPDFNAGAMENPGCVTLRETMLFRGRATDDERASRAGTMVHELAHQWFGDMVTMEWWDDLWLNESFAEYLAHRVATAATAYPLWTDFGIRRKAWGFEADQSPSSHPVAANGAPDAETALASFDGISYAKGAAVLRQLATRLGDDAFLGGLNAYLREHAWGNATAADLLSQWDARADMDLAAWEAAWLRTQGLDRLEVRDGTVVVVPPADGPRREHAVTVASFGPDGAQLGREDVVVSDKVSPTLPDGWWLPDADDQTWARVRPDLQHTPAISGIAAAASRVVVHNALTDAVRSAELDPRVAWDVWHRELPTEPELTIVDSLLAFARGPLLHYVPPARRADLVGELRDVAAMITVDAEPGSDRQLVGFRTLVACCDDERLLRAWLAGDEMPPLLTLDPDLRWGVVRRLAMVAADADVIDAELARDRSAAGQIAAARARASLPAPAAKEWALQVVTTCDDITPHQLYGVCEGLFPAEQAELVAPYAERWYDLVREARAVRTGWVLNRSVAASFPVSVPLPDAVERAAALVEDQRFPAGLRPVLLDGADRVRRAMESQSRFA